MKRILTALFFLIVIGATAQSVKLYNPDADVASDITKSLVRAKAENKHLFIQIGGNRCPWCVKFHNFCKGNSSIDSLMNKSFVVLKVNYSKENKNLPALKKLGFPQRFGFPVFVILDQTGTRLHTQNSAYLEEGDSYSKKKVLEFLNNWTPDALNPDRYKDK